MAKAAAHASAVIEGRRLSDILRRDLDRDPIVTGVTADSRKVGEGTLFCALPGTLNDGQTLPSILQAFIYIAGVQVDVITLISMIAASIVGAPRAVTNFSHCNVADDEIRAARVETDPAKQKELWKTAQEKIVKAVCGIPVYEQLQLWAWKDNLDLGYDLKGSLNLAPPVTEKTHFLN